MVETLFKLPCTTQMHSHTPKTYLPRSERLNQQLSLNQVLEQHSEDKGEVGLLSIHEARPQLLDAQIPAVVDLQTTNVLMEFLLAHSQTIFGNDSLD